jgi:hypothetical protein
MSSGDLSNPPSPAGRSWRELACNTRAALKALGEGQ